MKKKLDTKDLADQRRSNEHNVILNLLSSPAPS